mgnify:CR=1 FL=1
MKPLTTSIYTFSDLIRGGYQYVDKTAQIYPLVSEYKGQFFLSRPRRFGKSLLISTLKFIFLGQRELFEGLAIAETDYDWPVYPVIHLDLGSTVAEDVEDTKTALLELIDEQAADYGIELSNSLLQSRFRELIRKMAKDAPVVVLIDEYDKPLLGHIGRESAKDIQALLKQFYSVIKTTDSFQRFVLLTGVSKFSRVSVFSDLNNLTDLTMSRQAATLLGYTHEEVEANFPDYIQRLADDQGITVEQVLQTLRDWYDGYRFEETASTVYNPVSVMKCFQERKFQNYWFETGTPTFLLETLKRQPMDLEEVKVPEISFSSFEPADVHPLPLLLQTGYLTIKDYQVIGRRREYTLGYPNFEVEESFSAWLAQDFSNLSAPTLNSALHNVVGALCEGRVDDMLEHLKTFFSSVPNTITLDNEKYYQTIFFTVFKLIGTMIEAETSTNIGRIDAVIKTESDIYIFEFKIHGTAEEALDQIHEKQYAAPYADDLRSVTLVGAAFDPETRNIGAWVTEPAG